LVEKTLAVEDLFRLLFAALPFITRLLALKVLFVATFTNALAIQCHNVRIKFNGVVGCGDVNAWHLVLSALRALVDVHGPPWIVVHNLVIRFVADRTVVVCKSRFARKWDNVV